MEWMLPAGTRITDVDADIERAGVQLVKGFATIDHVALINVEVPASSPGTAFLHQYKILWYSSMHFAGIPIFAAHALGEAGLIFANAQNMSKSWGMCNRHCGTLVENCKFHGAHAHRQNTAMSQAGLPAGLAHDAGHQV